MYVTFTKIESIVQRTAREYAVQLICSSRLQIIIFSTCKGLYVLMLLRLEIL